MRKSIEEIKNSKSHESNEHWSSHEIAYAGFMHKHEEPEWITFAGKVFLTGILLGLSIEQITDYLFESFHGLGLDEIPVDWNSLEDDMSTYLKNI